jgi:tetratricopeptide (TPR) repeat protein
MKILGKSALLLAATLLCAPAVAETPATKVAEGNRLFREGEMERALELYNEAQQQLEDSSPVDYNIGNVLYRQGEYERALEEYRRALAADDPELARQARYNMGNAHFQAQQYDKAIEDFSDVLRLSPGDMDAKRNLELSLRALQQQPQQQQPQEGDSDQENDEQEQQQEGEQQSDEEQQQQQQEGEEQEGDQQQQEAEQEPSGQEEQAQQPQDGQGEPEPSDQPGNLDQANLSAQEAQRILDALREEEKENMKKAFRAPRRGRGTGKDW